MTVLAAESYTYPTSEPPTWTGNGTAEDPYVIDTAQELADLAWMVNNRKANYKGACYKLGGDIDLSGGLSYVNQVVTDPEHATDATTNAAKALFAYDRQTEAYFN